MSDLEPIQQSRLDEIGQILSQARQDKGMTLEEVSGKTLIRASILKAIEEGDARPLPEPVYIRGFIRRFGDLVGLNGTELCDSFPWQPSGSVPLSFVTAGAGVEAQPSVQSERDADEPLDQAGAGDLEEVSSNVSVREVTVSDTAGAQSALATEASSLEMSPEPPQPVIEQAESERQPERQPEPLAASSQSVMEATADEAVAGGGATVEPAEATPDHDAAYDSRAALFGTAGDDVAIPEPAEAAAPLSAGARDLESASVSDPTAVSEPDLGSRNTDVATLPPPPAPVTYLEPERRNPLPWILALVAALFGIGIVVFALGNRQTSSPQLAESPAAVEQAETPGDASGASEGDAAATAADVATATVPADKVVLELEVKGTEDAWMDVRVDGELKLEGNQVPGFKQSWDGAQEIELATARPDIVWVSVNGSKAQPFGQLAEANPVKVAGFKPANAESTAE